MGQVISNSPNRLMRRKKMTRLRKTMSLIKLSAGGSILAISMMGIITGIFGFDPHLSATAIVAILGGGATFIFLIWEFNIFKE